MTQREAIEENTDSDNQISAGMKRPGEYGPAGEMQGVDASFSVAQIAEAFQVDPERVRHAFAGEFQLAEDDRVDSRQAQDLAEAILGDQPQDVQQAALMTLGAFTPRSDHAWGAGEADPDEESDSQRPDQPGN